MTYSQYKLTGGRQSTFCSVSTTVLLKRKELVVYFSDPFDTNCTSKGWHIFGFLIVRK